MEGSVSWIRIALPTPKEIIAFCSKVQFRDQGRHTMQSKTLPAANNNPDSCCCRYIALDTDMCPWNKMCWEGIQQDIPLRVKLRLLLYFPPLEMLFSALHLYSPTSLAELIVKLNKPGVKSSLFKVDIFWLCLNNVYLTGGVPESEWQERLTFWFITTFKVPWTGMSMGLDSISGKKKILSEFTAPIIQETLRFFPKYVEDQVILISVEIGAYTFFLSPVVGNTTLYFSKSVCSLKHLMKNACLRTKESIYIQSQQIYPDELRKKTFEL